MVEHDLAKVGVEGSNPFARSNVLNDLAEFWGSSESLRGLWGNTGVTDFPTAPRYSPTSTSRARGWPGGVPVDTGSSPTRGVASK